VADVVVKLAVKAGEEARLFGLYLSRFMRSWSGVAEEADAAEAPWFIMRSEPGAGVELKTLVFQEVEPAQAFSHGWDETRAALG
jgi:hypothetical protein